MRHGLLRFPDLSCNCQLLNSRDETERKLVSLTQAICIPWICRLQATGRAGLDPRIKQAAAGRSHKAALDWQYLMLPDLTAELCCSLPGSPTAVPE